MVNDNAADMVFAVKDETAERPIPTAWRQSFRDIVDQFVAGNYTLGDAVAGVERVPETTAAHIRNYVADYGATLTALSEETWASSVCIRYGDHWQVLIDLWTAEEGRSDLVLHARVKEVGTSFLIEVELVYVP